MLAEFCHSGAARERTAVPPPGQIRGWKRGSSVPDRGRVVGPGHANPPPDAYQMRVTMPSKTVSADTIGRFR